MAERTAEQLERERQEIERIKELVAGLPRDDKGRLIYTLKEPIEFGKDTITELHIRKAKAGDMRHMPEDGRTVGHTLDLIARVSSQPPAVINELATADLGEVSAIIALF